jgi:xylose isomerase
MTPAEDALTPRPEHRFTFGLWTVGNPGRDPFGLPTRAPVDPVDSVHRLAELGAWGISLHDEDLVPWGTPAAERDRIVARFKGALEETGLGIGMATTNLFGHPAFKDGAFTSNDRGVRRAAIGKAMRSIDLGVELGADLYVFWGGREGTEAGVAKDPRDALERYREAIDVLGDYVVDQGYDLRFAMEPKPNEPRGDIFLPTVGHALHFISTLQRPEMVGVNPEVAHETMAGLSFYHGVGQALWAGKLFHIDLNAQRIGRYDQDFRFGAEDLKEAFHLVRLLERARYDGPRHFDAHAYRNEDAAGVWDFAAGCMRTYTALAERARHFDSLPEVQEALAAASVPELGQASCDGVAEADTLKGEAGGLDALAVRGYGNERLDQLRSAGLTARVVADGFLRVESLTRDGVELLVPGYKLPPAAAVHGRHGGITFLHPWANRLAADLYVVAGVRATLDGNPGICRDAHGLAIHGMPGEWTLDDDGVAELRHDGGPVFPFPHSVRVAFELVDDRALVIDTTVRPLGDGPVPITFGWHPYFRVPSGARETWVLSLPGESGPLGTRVLDDAHEGIEPHAVLGIGDVRVVFDEGYPVAQVFAPATCDVVSLEPMTAPTNALVSGHGLRVVGPGEAFCARFSVEVR